MGPAFTLGMVCVVVFVVIFAAKSQAHFKQAESLQDEEKSPDDEA